MKSLKKTLCALLLAGTIGAGAHGMVKDQLPAEVFVGRPVAVTYVEGYRANDRISVVLETKKKEKMLLSMSNGGYINIFAHDLAALVQAEIADGDSEEISIEAVKEKKYYEFRKLKIEGYDAVLKGYTGQVTLIPPKQ